MDGARAIKLSYYVNTILLLLVFGLWGFFALYKLELLVIFSVPTSLVYILNYLLIKNNKLGSFVRTLYLWLPFYMGFTTICLGYNYGFHLYTFSLIPIIFFTEYMSFKLNVARHKAKFFCAYIALIYIGCSSFVIFNGPIYKVEGHAANLFLFFNSAVVISFIVWYTSYTIKLMIKSEKQLSNLAHRDRLTGLYNRHFMIDRMNALKDDYDEEYWLAMIDIDDFKKVNDTYGHNCGDYVLNEVANLMNEVCPDCLLGRWGGEEFLLIGSDIDGMELMEEFRSKLYDKEFKYEEYEFKVSTTIGIASYTDGTSLENWIKTADDRLYYGKHNGKNQVCGGAGEDNKD